MRRASKSPNIIYIITDSVECVLGVWFQAITEVMQLRAGSILRRVTVGPWPAHRNAERELILQRLYLHSTVILREYFKNIPLKSCNIARIFIKLLERFLKYCRNLACPLKTL